MQTENVTSGVLKIRGVQPSQYVYGKLKKAHKRLLKDYFRPRCALNLRSIGILLGHVLVFIPMPDTIRIIYGYAYSFLNFKIESVLVSVYVQPSIKMPQSSLSSSKNSQRNRVFLFFLCCSYVSFLFPRYWYVIFTIHIKLCLIYLVLVQKLRNKRI